LPDVTALDELGFSPRWQALFGRHAAEGMAPARVVRTDRGSALVVTEAGLARAETSARLRKTAAGPADLPAVGDWVAVLSPHEHGPPQVDAVLERVSAITRGDPGKGSDVQVLAANVDTVFVVHPIVEPPNLRRIERELTLAWDSGATPVVVLTKADLSSDADEARAAVESVAPGVDVLAVNALSAVGVAPLLAYISDHRTAVLIGPSGVGKSTLINTLLGEQRQKTREVRLSDGRGQHTTVARELFQMPGGGVLIDTPGLRALGLTGSPEGISSAFPDIGALAGRCRFRDCTHVDEPGCTVQAAAASGELAPERLASYLQLVSEAHLASAKADERLRSQAGRKRASVDKSADKRPRRKDYRSFT
jgi:ribosome biogenesis GTPase / thiamine phosphate phosphatase